MIFPHTLLVFGNDYETCCQQACDFLKASKTLDYERVEVVETESCSGADANFGRRLNASLKKHRESIDFLVNELNQMGFHSVDDIGNVEQGYPSKVLHILGHLLDGYVCVDSRFYNLIDHSHQVAPATIANIQKQPQQHWLIRVNGHRESEQEARLFH